MAEAARSTGIVKWFSAQKGYGFIAPDHDGEDLFVHQTSIRSDGFRTLFENQPVEFSIESSEDGRSKAVDVVSVPRSRSSAQRGGRGGGRGYVGGRGRGSDGDSGGRGGGYGRGGGRSGGYNGGGSCYNCGKYGHIARDCYQSRGGGKRYGGGGGGGGGGCYNCGEEGHFARDCLNTDKM